MTRRDCLALGASAGAALFAGPARAGKPVEAVVELFSSQGCRSCPAADKLLAELRDMPGVLALTIHVDYWDYLGWKDTLASPEFSQRQYDYAKARGDMDVFTPQMIVNGNKQMVGSQRSEVFAVLAQSRKPSWPVPLMITDTAKEIVVEIGAGEAEQDATLWVMPVMERTSVKIEKGEMAGREVGLCERGPQARARRHVDRRGGAHRASQGRADAARRHRLRGAPSAGQGRPRPGLRLLGRPHQLKAASLTPPRPAQAARTSVRRSRRHNHRRSATA